MDLKEKRFGFMLSGSDYNPDYVFINSIRYIRDSDHLMSLHLNTYMC